MSDKPETLAAILAEFRAFALRAAEEDKMISPESVLLLADKVEAAAEREREAYCDLCKEKDATIDRLLLERDAHINDIHDALYKATGIPGNAAALREALEEQLRYWDSHIRTRDEEEMRKRTEAALAVPARNCDRTKDAAEDLFKNRFGRPWTQTEDELAAWLFAPAKGGDHA